MIAQGLDGCRAGWVCVRLDAGGGAEWGVVTRLADALDGGVDLSIVDIPIGLPPSGRRRCDIEARRILGRARARVFLDARRPLLGFVGDYPGANAWGKGSGAGVARELFAILPKIAEADAAMEGPARDRLREGHPELTFHRLNGGSFVESKRTPAGVRTRLDLLSRHGLPQATRWLDARRGTGAGADDVLDAAALALSARDALAGTARRLPAEGGPTDERGLRTEMWY